MKQGIVFARQVLQNSGGNLFGNNWGVIITMNKSGIYGFILKYGNISTFLLD